MSADKLMDINIDLLHRTLNLKKKIQNRFINPWSNSSFNFFVRSSGKQTFILTNSDWWYTDSIMTHLLGQSWCSMFDLVIVDASKPKFFSGNQEPRLLDKKISGNSTPIYSGGNKVSNKTILKVPLNFQKSPKRHIITIIL